MKEGNMDSRHTVNFVGEFFSMSVVVNVTEDDVRDLAIGKAEQLLRDQYEWEVRPMSKIAIEVEEWV